MATTAKTTAEAEKAKRTGLVTKNNATAMPKKAPSKNKITVTVTATKTK